MRRFVPLVIWFIGGVIPGQFAESVLTPLWMKLGLLLPVGRWLDSFGIKGLDWCWLVVDIWLVSWLIAVLVSIIGGLYIRHQFSRSIVLFGVGLLLCHWAFILTCIRIFPLWQTIGSTLSFSPSYLFADL